MTPAVPASVADAPQPMDSAIWRVVGDPLVAGSATGPLRGSSVAVKDLFAVAGHAIGAGNPTYLAGAAAEETTAPAVQALLDAGASLRGIARTDEFAYSIAGDSVHYGTPPNGAVPGALPGGSSSGPASAVALGHADIGLATDTAGSIRVPASYQGLWGLRTTHGLVSREGLLPLAPSFDAVGWLARDGSALEAVAEACVPETGGEGLDIRFLVPIEALEAAEPETRAAFERLLVRLDAPVERFELGPLAHVHEAFRVVQAAEAWRAHGDWIRAHPGSLGDAVAARFAAASRISPDEEAAARAALEAPARRLREAVRSSPVLVPTVPGPAPALTADPTRVDAVRTATLRMTAPVSVAGIPALSVPLLAVPAPRGTAPVGVCVASRAGTDAALVRLGRRIADLTTPEKEGPA